MGNVCVLYYIHKKKHSVYTNHETKYIHSLISLRPVKLPSELSELIMKIQMVFSSRYQMCKRLHTHVYYTYTLLLTAGGYII